MQAGRPNFGGSWHLYRTAETTVPMCRNMGACLTVHDRTRREFNPDVRPYGKTCAACLRARHREGNN